MDENLFSLDSLPVAWFAPRISYLQMCARFSEGKHEIRMATGFFTIAGWSLIRKSTSSKKVFLLVGLDEPAEDKAREMLVAEIIKELARGDGNDRRQSVLDLVNRIESGQFEMIDARAMQHHGKLYLVDRRYAIFTSSNTTRRGFIDQNETGILVEIKPIVESLVNQFDYYFAEATNITQELLEALKRWLELATPWEIYLKTMLCLEDLQPTSRAYKEPAGFQRDIIARILRHIRKHRGAYLVASTGLGKTVIASHVAVQMYDAKEIDNIMVIGPKGTQQNWVSELRQAHLPGSYFTYFAIDQKTAERDSSLEEFQRIAEQEFNDRWLLIIDESHVLRKSKEEEEDYRNAFKRLLPLIKKSGCFVLSMTGSPYSTKISNVNWQLRLLPHTAPSRVLFPDFFKNVNAWSIQEINELKNLDVASLMSLPQVAKVYGKTDEHGLYIMYGVEKKYIPEVILNRVDYSLMLEENISKLFTDRILKERSTRSGASIENHARIAWASSPKELKEFFEKVLETPNGINKFDVEFTKPLDVRYKAIAPIIKKLERRTLLKDQKFSVLMNILSNECSLGKKVIIFCERRATVIYLEEGIKKELPAIKVFGTVRKEKGGYDTKSEQVITRGLSGFAPRSFFGVTSSKKSSALSYDVLVTTDAYGVGINLQDASVVINYDLAWTPINPIQRAGRVLRPWQEPRTIQIYTFVPHLSDSSEKSWELELIGIRWDVLKNRHNESLQVVDLGVLPEEATHKIYMPDVASSVTIRSVPLDLEELSDIEISDYFMHTSKLQQHRQEALEIPDDITSAMLYKGKHHAVYVLVRVNASFEWMVYNTDKKRLETLTDIDLLNIIQCDENTPTALVNPNRIEECATEAIKLWCNTKNVQQDDVFRICTMYLHPKVNEPEISKLFASP